MSKGNVLTICDNCENTFRTEVEFPFSNKGFTTKIDKCPHCGIELKIFDEHIYNEDGTIQS